MQITKNSFSENDIMSSRDHKNGETIFHLPESFHDRNEKRIQ